MNSVCASTLRNAQRPTHSHRQAATGEPAERVLRDEKRLPNPGLVGPADVLVPILSDRRTALTLSEARTIYQAGDCTTVSPLIRSPALPSVGHRIDRRMRRLSCRHSYPFSDGINEIDRIPGLTKKRVHEKRGRVNYEKDAPSTFFFQRSFCPLVIELQVADGAGNEPSPASS